MLPVVTFAAGLIAGAVGLQLLKKAKTPAGLRRAAVSGLSAVERSSADLRAKLEPTAVEAEPAEVAETQAEAVTETAQAEAGPETGEKREV